MGFDDLCNTGLVLGLGFPASSSSPEFKSKRPRHVQLSEPSLTLSLSGENYAVKKVEVEDHHHHDHHTGEHQDDDDSTMKEFVYNYNNYSQSCDLLYRQDSAASSFSSVKREREIASSDDNNNNNGELIQRNTINSMNHLNNTVQCSRISDEDDDGSNGRKKLRLSKAQSALLEESFKHHSTLNPKQKQDLARELNLRPRQVEVWFQNRRARTKLKQTEVDCEFLKKCCESLTDENRRLQKEVQELKALKMAQPLYMAATLTMCPSCESLTGENAAKTAYAMTPKSHFYTSFTNQSAAC